MYAQLIHFDGPRGPELVAAGDRANRDRIQPAMLAAGVQDDLVALYVLRQPDGGEVTIVITNARSTFDRAQEVAMSTTLLPGEDPMLLPGPDRVEVYEVVHATSAADLVGAGVQGHPDVH